MEKYLATKVLVIGCSKLGALVASKASADGNFVTIINQNKEDFIKLDPSYSGYTIEGDATEMQTLEKARVGEMDEVDIFTDNDDTNVFLTMLIEHYYPNVSKIIVRLTDDSKEALIESRKVKVVSPIALSLKQYDKVKEDR